MLQLGVLGFCIWAHQIFYIFTLLPHMLEWPTASLIYVECRATVRGRQSVICPTTCNLQTLANLQVWPSQILEVCCGIGPGVSDFERKITESSESFRKSSKSYPLAQRGRCFTKASQWPRPVRRLPFGACLNVYAMTRIFIFCRSFSVQLATSKSKMSLASKCSNSTSSERLVTSELMLRSCAQSPQDTLG